MTPIDARWQMVTCRECGKRYLCTPSQDYFEATTLEDGLCWDCFLPAKGMPPQPEPEAQ
jgi:hypothetical protein